MSGLPAKRWRRRSDTAANVGYVDAIDPALYLTATRATNHKRWKVRHNLPGPRGFLPLVYLARQSERNLYDVQAGVERLNTAYGADLLLRSAAWLTLKESRASFAIEREQEQGPGQALRCRHRRAEL